MAWREGGVCVGGEEGGEGQRPPRRAGKIPPTRVGAAGTHHPLHPHCCAYTGSPRRPAAMVTGAHREAHSHQCGTLESHPPRRHQKSSDSGGGQGREGNGPGTTERHKEGHSCRHRAPGLAYWDTGTTNAEGFDGGRTAGTPASMHAHAVYVGQLQGHVNPYPSCTLALQSPGLRCHCKESGGGS